MARLTKIGVGGFKSIRDLQPLELHPINVFVGANGAGKSNLISFFRLLKAIGRARLQAFVRQAGGADTLFYYGTKVTPRLSISLEFEGKTGSRKYFTWLASTETDSVFREEQVDERATTHLPCTRRSLGSGHRETFLDASGSPEFADLLGQIGVFHFADTSESAPIRRRSGIDDNRELHHDGGNLAAFLFAIRETQPEYYRRIVTTIQQVAPFFDDFALAPLKLDLKSVQLDWRDRDSEYPFGSHQLSDGTLRTMALIALLAQPESDLPSVIVIDEPEIGLHPYALEIVAALVKSASVHTTIVLATQSAGLVNYFAPEDIVTVTRDKAESKFERQNAVSLAAWLQDYSMGEIWERNLIGGTPSR
ncbi:MAG: AAA family ATPase [Bryobacteraceae bacterium]